MDTQRAENWLTVRDLRNRYGGAFAYDYQELAEEGRLPFPSSPNAGKSVCTKTPAGWLFEPSEVERYIGMMVPVGGWSKKPN